MNTYRDNVTLLQAGLIDGYGGQRVRDWANAESTALAAAVQPRMSTELIDGRQVTTSGFMMFCAPDAGVRTVDRVVWRGNTYEVDGAPALHLMGGTPDHLEVTLQRIEEVAT